MTDQFCNTYTTECAATPTAGSKHIIRAMRTRQLVFQIVGNEISCESSRLQVLFDYPGLVGYSYLVFFWAFSERLVLPWSIRLTIAAHLDKGTLTRVSKSSQWCVLCVSWNGVSSGCSIQTETYSLTMTNERFLKYSTSRDRL